MGKQQATDFVLFGEKSYQTCFRKYIQIKEIKNKK